MSVAVNVHYFPSSNVYLKVSNLPDVNHNTNANGLWGITLKNDNSNVGIKLAHSLKKRVVALDAETNEVKHQFDSLSEAARFLPLLTFQMLLKLI